MCGIAGIALHRKEGRSFPVTALAECLLLNNESRGTDATGWLAITAGARKDAGFRLCKEPITATEFVRLHALPTNARVALLHTRHFTKGKPDQPANNHPVSLGSCYVIHNGAIANDDDLVKELKYEDKRIGEVDSWAIPMALTHFDAFASKDNLIKALDALKGSMAIAAIDPVNHPNKLILAKGHYSPLHVLTTPHGVFWSSEAKALRDAWGDAVGTPPQGKITHAGDFGWHEMAWGEAWVLDFKGPHTDIDVVKFTPTASNYDRNTNGVGHVGQGYRQYTRRTSPWTCWPNTKDCIFGDSCGDCENQQCRCWEGNKAHPKLNKDITFKDAIEKHPSFKSHCDRFKLTEDMVISFPPTKGGGQRTGNGQPRTTSTSTSESQADTGSTKCYFCTAVQSTKLMRKLATKIPGATEAAYECTACQVQPGMSGDTPTGHDAACDGLILAWTGRGEAKLKAHEEAVNETAWEFRVPPAFVQVCVLWKNNVSSKTMPEFNQLAAAIGAAYSVNYKVLYNSADTKE